MADLTTRAGKGSPLTNAEVDANFTNLNTDKVETGLAALDAYDTSIADTAVDVFVYDTSRDSDGGAWRKRTQHTSWYNETLNTATRGSRREFPAVAVIVAESSQVTIYDGDDPSLPMWMVFNTGGTWPFLINGNIRAVTAKNGTLLVARNSLSPADFIGDRTAYITNTNNGSFGGMTIAQRNTARDFTQGVAWISSGFIVDDTVNDVAMTVLLDAPIDPATGLPVPTIAVATDGGVSVITDSGAVYDLTYNISNPVSMFVAFDGSGGIYWGSGEFYSGANLNTRLFWNESLPTADDSSAPDMAWNINSNPSVRGNYFPNNAFFVDGNTFAISTDTTVLNTVSVKYGDLAGSMVAYTTSDYATGWMNGDIKGAFLSDTDDTDLFENDVASGFDFTDASWSIAGTGTITGANTFTMTSNGGAAGGNLLEAGVTYVVVFDITATSRLRMYNSGGSQTRQIGDVGSGSNLTGFFTFKAANPDIYFRLDSAGDVTINSISIKLADKDRSRNQKGLVINGTITKNPVATGADLVAYSGFSSTNYLEQPYNSDLDFGTGDFCVMGWVKTSSAGIDRVFVRDSVPTAQNFSLYVDASGKAAFLCDDDTTVRTATSSGSVASDTWRHLCGVYDGAGGVFIYVDGILAGSATGSSLLTLDNASATLIIGNQSSGTLPFAGSLALFRISATAPTAEQIAKIYEDEKFLFQDGAQATLYGSSDAVTALAHDEVTDLLHVGTSSGRSVFQGLRRVDNTTDAVGVAISAYDGLVVED